MLISVSSSLRSLILYFNLLHYTKNNLIKVTKHYNLKSIREKDCNLVNAR